MVGAQKTLKVTYGSFSCTLEGFDDPVAALVAVTTHFQSLAEPDRLFAAEGPVPDAEMLLRLPEPVAPVQQATRAGADVPAAEPTRPAEGGLPAPDLDADVSRLLSQTMVEMQGADQRRRLATIGHLKAAVAVTAGDPGAGLEDLTRQDRYRADLARMVRPPRPNDRSPPPMPDRHDPLLLVPELRVPRPEPEGEGITTAKPPHATASFADLAGQMGSATLADLIETAAAFLICTGAGDSFSRPDLMRQLSTLPGRDGGSPEDQMRGFGSLLRDGRLLRAGRGSFALPPDAAVLARARGLIG